MGKSFLITVTNDLNQDQRMHRICNALVQDGHKVMLLGRKKSNSLPLLNHSFDQKRLKCFFSKGFLFYLEYNIRILFFALNFKPDVFYSVDLDTLLGNGISARITRKKIIHDAHEYFVEVPELEGKSFKKWIWNSIGKNFIPKCDLCFSVNKELAEILSEKYNNKFHVVRSTPISEEKNIEVKLQNQTPVVLYQGVLNKGRGLEDTILAVKDMKQDVDLRIAGEGDISDELRSLVDRLELKHKVQFLGWLSPKELKQETQKADIGLNLLSAKSLNYKYSLANKFFDYMHAGIPSINMNFPVYSRICKEYEVGVCIEALDQKSIQNAIVLLIEDKEKLSRIKKACKKARSKYNWENESRVLINLINVII